MTAAATITLSVDDLAEMLRDYLLGHDRPLPPLFGRELETWRANAIRSIERHEARRAAAMAERNRRVRR